VSLYVVFFFFFQAEDGIRDVAVTGVQTCALPIYPGKNTCRTWPRSCSLAKVSAYSRNPADLSGDSLSISIAGLAEPPRMVGCFRIPMLALIFYSSPVQLSVYGSDADTAQFVIPIQDKTRDLHSHKGTDCTLPGIFGQRSQYWR